MDKRDEPLYGVKGLPVKVKSDVKNESFSHVILRSFFSIYAFVQSQKAITANCLLFKLQCGTEWQMRFCAGQLDKLLLKPIIVWSRHEWKMSVTVLLHCACDISCFHSDAWRLIIIFNAFSEKSSTLMEFSFH